MTPVLVSDALLTPVVAAGFAALGFLGKHLLGQRDARQAARAAAERERNEAAAADQERRTGLYQALLQLQDDLAESRAVFVGQRELAARLAASIRRNHRDVYPKEAGIGYDDIFYRSYEVLDESELQLHRLIRATTQESLRRANARLDRWTEANLPTLREQNSTGVFSDLLPLLQQLRRHLEEWNVKYTAVFRDDERRTVVYLADEQAHGTGFPPFLDETLETVIDTLKADAAWVGNRRAASGE